VGWDGLAWQAAELLFGVSNVLEKGARLISIPTISFTVLNKINQVLSMKWQAAYHAAGHAIRNQAWIIISNC